jgi:hypothetical protein
MPAYIIARVQVTDWEQYREYMKATPAAIERFGGRFVVCGRKIRHLEAKRCPTAQSRHKSRRLFAFHSLRTPAGGRFTVMPEL